MSDSESSCGLELSINITKVVSGTIELDYYTSMINDYGYPSIGVVPKGSVNLIIREDEKEILTREVKDSWTQIYTGEILSHSSLKDADVPTIHNYRSTCSDKRVPEEREGKDMVIYGREIVGGELAIDFYPGLHVVLTACSKLYVKVVNNSDKDDVLFDGKIEGDRVITEKDLVKK